MEGMRIKSYYLPITIGAEQYWGNAAKKLFPAYHLVAVKYWGMQLKSSSLPTTPWKCGGNAAERFFPAHHPVAVKYGGNALI